MHIRSVIPVLATVFGCLSAPAVATELLFSADFESAPPYGFRGTYRLSDNYQITPAPGQGWKGSRAAHILERAHKRQYNLGWFSGTPRHWGPGDTMVVRFRIKFDPNWRWDGEGSMQNKMFDVGVVKKKKLKGKTKTKDRPKSAPTPKTSSLKTVKAGLTKKPAPRRTVFKPSKTVAKAKLPKGHAGQKEAAGKACSTDQAQEGLPKKETRPGAEDGQSRQGAQEGACPAHPGCEKTGKTAA